MATKLLNVYGSQSSVSNSGLLTTSTQGKSDVVGIEDAANDEAWVEMTIFSLVGSGHISMRLLDKNGDKVGNEARIKVQDFNLGTPVKLYNKTGQAAADNGSTAGSIKWYLDIASFATGAIEFECSGKFALELQFYAQDSGGFNAGIALKILSNGSGHEKVVVPFSMTAP